MRTRIWIKNGAVIVRYPESTLLPLVDGVREALLEASEFSTNSFGEVQLNLSSQDLENRLRDGMVSYAHRMAAKTIEEHFDANALAKLGYWYAKSDTSSANKSKITAVENWKDSVWTHYDELKLQFLNGENPSVDYSFLGNPPMSFSELKTDISV